jgi:hypothetical protein
MPRLPGDVGLNVFSPNLQSPYSMDAFAAIASSSAACDVYALPFSFFSSL